MQKFVVVVKVRPDDLWYSAMVSSAEFNDDAFNFGSLKTHTHLFVFAPSRLLFSLLLLGAMVRVGFRAECVLESAAGAVERPMDSHAQSTR